MRETSDYLENIVNLLYVIRKKNQNIGARLKHFYISETRIMVRLTGNGWITLELALAVNGVQEITDADIQKVLHTFERRIQSENQRRPAIYTWEGLMESIRNFARSVLYPNIN
jgi:hypothetical protein